MKDFKNKLAVVTGGGTGMGRELVLALVRDGAHVAMCDLMQDTMDETARLAREANDGVRVTSHLCDVSSEEAMNRFRDEVVEAHDASYARILLDLEHRS